MPKILLFKNLVFFFYAYDLTERLHLHIVNSRSERSRSAKIWLDTLEIFEEGSLTKKELKVFQQLIEENINEILEQISRFAQGEKVEIINLN
ncbi:uncharacterized protein DUF4160 [Arcicella aurantiaca]|uniref:Uncharacterized protein DUF4160 n=1 Tax=Arcicella aurantiaca TaxID=591202 RepID=A0A316E6M3_9BACT|nr:DUF4160 domain-containing protein [Arcicella aurantiaca]PWK26367.1 uncharacterized protein DUF4160 [Arcicella aurantiaca]